jgi:hypothetical protein
LDENENLLDLRIQLGEFQFQNRLPGMQHHINGTSQRTQTPLNRCPHAPPDTVALYRPTQSFTHGETNSRASLVVTYSIKRRHIPRKMSLALLIDSLKVRMLQQP